MTSHHPTPTPLSQLFLTAGRGPAGPSWPGDSVSASEGRGRAQASPGSPSGLLRLPGPAGRRPRTYRLHAGPGGGQRPCRAGRGQNRTEETVRPSATVTPAQPGVGRGTAAGTGTPVPGGAVCTPTGVRDAMRAACPPLPAGPQKPLTFLHRDGGLLLPKPQQDEKQDERDEDLEGQDPLERAGGVRPPAQGRTGHTQTLLSLRETPTPPRASPAPLNPACPARGHRSTQVPQAHRDHSPFLPEPL